MTQTERVLAELRARGRSGLTDYEAERAGCGSRLAARISDLKAAGQVIDDEFVTVPSRTDGGSSRVKRYWLRETPTAPAPMAGSQESWL